MIENCKTKKKEILFFTAYIIFLLYKILNTSTFKSVLSNTIISYIKIFSWSLFVLKIILCNKKNFKIMIKQKIIYSILFLISIIVRIYSGSSEIFELFLVAIAASDIEFSNIAKVTLTETLILCGVIITSSLIGIIPNHAFYRSNGQLTMALGFIYVGKLSSYVLQIVFLSLYLYEEKNIKRKQFKTNTIFYNMHIRVFY